MKIKAIIWDMDGTLIDSEKHHSNAEIATMKEFGVDLTHDVIREFMGCTLKEYCEALVKRFNLSVGAEDIMKKHQLVLDKYYAEIFPAVPHVKEVIGSLKGRYLMGLATSAGRGSAEAALSRIGVLDYFVARTYGTDVDFGKPDPEIFLKTAEKLGVGPEEVVVIEDSENGFNAAKSAGMKLIARRAHHNMHQNFSLADFVVEDLLDVPGCLMKLEKV